MAADDPLIDDRLERPLHAVKLLGWVVIVLGVAWLVIEVALAARSVRQSAEAVRQEALPELIDASREWAAFSREQKRVVEEEHARIGQSIEHVETILATVDQQTMGEIVRAARALRETSETLRDTAQRGPGIADETQRTLEATTATIGGVKQVVDDARNYLARDEAELHRLLAGLAATTENLVVISEPKAYQELTEHGAGFVRELEGATAESRRILEYVRQRVIPPPREWSKNAFKRFWQKAGYYSLVVLKSSPQLVLVGLRFVGP